MQEPLSPSRADWHPGHVPRLSYRTTPTIDSSTHSPTSPAHTHVAYINRDIPASRLPNSPTNVPKSPALNVPPLIRSSKAPQARTWIAPSQPPKKKNSLFGGLFAKEASSAALEQVAANLIAQHGELSARAVPGVSSQKMPDFVPKVNSKWDGVPEATKIKERQEKERARAMKRQSGVPGTHRSRSADSSSGQRQSTHSRDRRNSNSTLSSFDSRGGAGDKYRSQHLKYSMTSRPESYRASSSGEGLSRSGRPDSNRAASLKSPSKTSLPEITSFFPNDIPAPPPVPVRYLSNASKTSAATISTDRTRYDATISSEASEPAVDAIPEYSSSPLLTPLERSPITPSLAPLGSRPISQALTPRKHLDVMLVSRGPDVLGVPATVAPKRSSVSPAGAFLAGEAQPLELPDDHTASVISNDLPLRSWKSPPVLTPIPRIQQDLERRPDSSRARLGLRASMLIRTESVPWIDQEMTNRPNSELRSNTLNTLGSRSNTPNTLGSSSNAPNNLGSRSNTPSSGRR